MHSLRFKLIAPFVVGMVLLSLSIVWYTYWAARQEMEGAVVAISEARTSHVTSSMHFFLRSASTALHNMVIDPEVIRLLDGGTETEEGLDRASEWMEIIARSNEYYRDLDIVDASGRCVASSNPGNVGKARGHETYVRDALGGHFASGDFSVGRVTRKFSVTMAGPVTLGTHLGGAVVLVMDFPRIVDYSEPASRDLHKVYTQILTPEGFFAAHPEKDLVGNISKLYTELYEELAVTGEAGAAVHYVFNNEHHIGYASVDPATKWVVVTSGAETEVLSSAYAMGRTVTIIGVVFLFCIGIVVLRFASDILNAMLGLIGYAKAVSDGDLDRELAPTSRRDELGVLHGSLQKLVSTLKDILQETRKASEMKGQFLANMSHEIRTPLNAIIGITHLALNEDGLPTKAQMFLEKIQMSSRLLFGIINDILDLSKVEAGMMELECLPFEPRQTLSNVVGMHLEAAHDKGLDLRLECADDVPVRLTGDALRIGQVMNNLVSNAIKFTSEGSVVIRCKRLSAEEAHAAKPRTEHVPLLPPVSTSDSAAESVFLRVSVTDTGSGITAEALTKLFQPFTQADATITRKFGGTGLGLTICEKLVYLMGGRMEVESEYGQGTSMGFVISLSLPDEAQLSAAEALDRRESKTYFEGRKILVAEDNHINQLILDEVLTQMGVSVCMADNGQEALDSVLREDFDLVLMDMQMPVMDGLEATRRIREHILSVDLPIIALTANALKEDKQRCFDCGMNAFLTKPIEPAVLVEVLEEWLRDKPARL